MSGDIPNPLDLSICPVCGRKAAAIKRSAAGLRYVSNNRLIQDVLVKENWKGVDKQGNPTKPPNNVDFKQFRCENKSYVHYVRKEPKAGHQNNFILKKTND